MAYRGGVFLAVSLLLLGGCGTSTSSGATQPFLTSVHQMAPDIGGYSTDSDLVRLGHAVCDDLSSGASLQQVADRVGYIGAGARLPSADLGAVMMAATETMCPRYSKLFGSGGPG